MPTLNLMHVDQKVRKVNCENTKSKFEFNTTLKNKLKTKLKQTRFVNVLATAGSSIPSLISYISSDRR